MDRTKLVVCVAGLILASGSAVADPGDRAEEYFDNKGDRIEDRLDAKGDRIDNKLDRRSNLSLIHI